MIKDKTGFNFKTISHLEEKYPHVKQKRENAQIKYLLKIRGDLLERGIAINVKQLSDNSGLNYALVESLFDRLEEIEPEPTAQPELVFAPDPVLILESDQCETEALNGLVNRFETLKARFVCRGELSLEELKELLGNFNDIQNAAKISKITDSFPKELVFKLRLIRNSRKFSDEVAKLVLIHSQQASSALSKNHPQTIADFIKSVFSKEIQRIRIPTLEEIAQNTGIGISKVSLHIKTALQILENNPDPKLKIAVFWRKNITLPLLGSSHHHRDEEKIWNDLRTLRISLMRGDGYLKKEVNRFIGLDIIKQIGEQLLGVNGFNDWVQMDPYLLVKEIINFIYFPGNLSELEQEIDSGLIGPDEIVNYFNGSWVRWEVVSVSGQLKLLELFAKSLGKRAGLLVANDFSRPSPEFSKSLSGLLNFYEKKYNCTGQVALVFMKRDLGITSELSFEAPETLIGEEEILSLFISMMDSFSWKRTTKEARGKMVALLADELKVNPGDLRTTHFAKRIARFNGKTLAGLLDYYMARFNSFCSWMAVKELKKDLGILSGAAGYEPNISLLTGALTGGRAEFVEELVKRLISMRILLSAQGLIPIISSCQINLDDFMSRIAENIVRAVFGSDQITESLIEQGVLQLGTVVKINDLDPNFEDSEIEAILLAGENIFARNSRLPFERACQDYAPISRVMRFNDVFNWLLNQAAAEDAEEFFFLVNDFVETAWYVSASWKILENAKLITEEYGRWLGPVEYFGRQLKQRWLVVIRNLAPAGDHASLTETIKVYNNYFGEISFRPDLLKICWFTATYCVALNHNCTALEETIKIVNEYFGDVGSMSKDLHKHWLSATSLVAMDAAHKDLGNLIVLFEGNIGRARMVSDNKLLAIWLIGIGMIAKYSSIENKKYVLDRLNSCVGNLQNASVKLKTWWLKLVIQVLGIGNKNYKNVKRIFDIAVQVFGSIKDSKDEFKESWLRAVRILFKILQVRDMLDEDIIKELNKRVVAVESEAVVLAELAEPVKEEIPYWKKLSMVVLGASKVADILGVSLPQNNDDWRDLQDAIDAGEIEESLLWQLVSMPPVQEVFNHIGYCGCTVSDKVDNPAGVAVALIDFFYLRSDLKDELEHELYGLAEQFGNIRYSLPLENVLNHGLSPTLDIFRERIFPILFEGKTYKDILETYQSAPRSPPQDKKSNKTPRPKKPTPVHLPTQRSVPLAPLEETLIKFYPEYLSELLAEFSTLEEAIKEEHLDVDAFFVWHKTILAFERLQRDFHQDTNLFTRDELLNLSGKIEQVKLTEAQEAQLVLRRDFIRNKILQSGQVDTIKSFPQQLRMKVMAFESNKRKLLKRIAGVIKNLGRKTKKEKQEDRKQGLPNKFDPIYGEGFGENFREDSEDGSSSPVTSVPISCGTRLDGTKTCACGFCCFFESLDTLAGGMSGSIRRALERFHNNYEYLRRSILLVNPDRFKMIQQRFANRSLEASWAALFTNVEGLFACWALAILLDCDEKGNLTWLSHCCLEQQGKPQLCQDYPYAKNRGEHDGVCIYDRFSSQDGNNIAFIVRHSVLKPINGSVRSNFVNGGVYYTQRVKKIIRKLFDKFSFNLSVHIQLAEFDKFLLLQPVREDGIKPTRASSTLNQDIKTLLNNSLSLHFGYRAFRAISQVYSKLSSTTEDKNISLKANVSFYGLAEYIPFELIAYVLVDMLLKTKKYAGSIISKKAAANQIDLKLDELLLTGESELAKSEMLSDPFTQQGLEKIAEFALSVSGNKTGMFLKEKKLLQLLEINPPKKLISVYRAGTLEGLLKIVDIQTAFTLARYVEPRKWLRTNINSCVRILSGQDFEERPIRVVIFKELPDCLVSYFKNKLPFSNDKLAGVLCGFPVVDLEENKIPRLRAISRAFHYIHEISFYSDVISHRILNRVYDGADFGQAVGNIFENYVDLAMFFEPHALVEALFMVESLQDMKKVGLLSFSQELKDADFALVIEDGVNIKLTSLIDHITVLSKGYESDLHARRYLRLAPILYYFNNINVVRRFLSLSYNHPSNICLAMANGFSGLSLRPISIKDLLADYPEKVENYLLTASSALSEYGNVILKIKILFVMPFIESRKLNGKDIFEVLRALDKWGSELNLFAGDFEDELPYLETLKKISYVFMPKSDIEMFEQLISDISAAGNNLVSLLVSSQLCSCGQLAVFVYLVLEELGFKNLIAIDLEGYQEVHISVGTPGEGSNIFMLDPQYLARIVYERGINI
ncbi:MAG: hypothetical protein HZC15_03070 [Candidatus Omnitrophica bacterium]|nr:hypothetical protein [Candidatus Omnitrophota bacterium]